MWFLDSVRNFAPVCDADDAIFSRAPITSSLMDVSEHPAYFAYVIRHLDEDGDGMIGSDEMNNALN